MKVYIEIPDDLYREVVALCALEGRSIEEVWVDLFRRYVREDTKEGPHGTVELPTELDGKPLPPWFGILNKYSRQMQHHDMREIRQSIAAGLSRKYGLNV